MKETFKASLQGWALQLTVERKTSNIGLMKLAVAGPGRWLALRGGSFRTPLSWSGGRSPTSPVRVQFLGKVVDIPIVLQFFDMEALVPVVQVLLLRLGPDRSVVPQIMEEIVKVPSIRFCCTPMACLPLPVVRVSTWCFGCRLRNSRWHRLLEGEGFPGKLLKTLLKPVEIPQVQFLGWFFTPVVVQRLARVVQTVQSGIAAGAVPAVVDVPGLVCLC